MNGNINKYFDSPSSPSLRVERDDNVADFIRVSNSESIKFPQLIINK